MRRTLRTLLLLTTLLMLASPAIPVHADVAPPEKPEGSVTGIEPGQATKVQMVAEEVVIDLAKEPSEYSSSKISMTATFQMRNQGTESESMRVGFPVGCDEVGNIYSVTVDGLEVDTDIEEGKEKLMLDARGKCISKNWIRFDVTFPPEQDVMIVVKLSYFIQVFNSYIYYAYILETGAGWYGPIGKGAFVFNLPYQPENINLQGSWDSSLILSRVYSDHSARFTFNDLEPTENHNLYFVIGKPTIWCQVDTARQAVEVNPRDPTAYIQLGQAYKAASSLYQGTDLAVAKLALESYNQALNLDPYAVDAHVGVANVILSMNNPDSNYDIDIYSDPYKPVLDHLAKALALDPENYDALELMDYLYYFSNEDITLPPVDPTWLKNAITPTSLQTQHRMVTPTITYTPSPFKSRTPRVSKSPYQTFTREPGKETLTPDLLLSATAPVTIVPTENRSASPQPTAQTRLVLYLILIGLMAGAGFVMWRREQA